MAREFTEQEKFWKDKFGKDYTDRNLVTPEARKPYFANVIAKTSGVQKICELGANKGHNLESFGLLGEDYSLTGVEINQYAYGEMASNKRINAVNSSIQNYSPDDKFDLVFTCGVLIHIAPDDLPDIYRKMFGLSKKYILINEYFNPVPAVIEYRGHENRLFKRDFGGEFWDMFPERLKLLDYGFQWKRVEPTWDDTTWWLFEKTG